MRGLAEAEGVRVAGSPYRVPSYHVTPGQLNPGEPACLGCGDDASKREGGGEAGGIPLPCTSLSTTRRLAHLFLLQ